MMLRYLVQNLDWLQDLLTEYNDDDYFIFDCPGKVTSPCGLWLLKSPT
jgi:hypothetical protein